MNRSPNEMKDGTRDGARDERAGATPGEDAGTFDRSFKYAVIIYAVVEFVAIALVIYYKLAR